MTTNEFIKKYKPFIVKGGENAGKIGILPINMSQKDKEFCSDYMANHKSEVITELQRMEIEQEECLKNDRYKFKEVSTRRVNFFGKEYKIECFYDVENAIKSFKEIKEVIKQTQYIDLAYCSVLPGNYIRVLGDFGNLETWKSLDDRISEYVRNNELSDIFDVDSEATLKRNEEFTGEHYRVGTYKREVQEAIIAKCNEYIEQMTELGAEIETEARKKMSEEEAKRNEWEEIKVHKHISPKGGEMGTDGYHDATYRRKSDGAEVRIISRDIFDVGKFSVPYRETKNENQEKTETEASCINWLVRYKPVFGNGVRM